MPLDRERGGPSPLLMGASRTAASASGVLHVYQARASCGHGGDALRAWRDEGRVEGWRRGEDFTAMIALPYLQFDPLRFGPASAMLAQHYAGHGIEVRSAGSEPWL